MPPSKLAPDKQTVLKTLDFVLTVRVAVNRDRAFLIAQLADTFEVSLSTIHGSLGRAEAAGLLSRSSGYPRANSAAVREFAIHGAKYAFAPVAGPSTRGIATAIGAPVLARHFEATDALVPVWPHPQGQTFGFELVPLHPSVPRAALKDDKLYEALALIDAIRAGAAREREIAINELQARI